MTRNCMSSTNPLKKMREEYSRIGISMEHCWNIVYYLNRVKVKSISLFYE